MQAKLLLLVLTCSTLFAGPPMLSDDPFVPNLGQFEVNLAASVEMRDATVLKAPIIDANYGLVKNVQVTFAVGYINTDQQSDFDALELAFKWNFYSGDVFAIAVNPKYLVSPTNSIFNEGEVYEVSFPMNIVLSEKLNLVISPAYIYPLEESAYFELGSYLQYTQGNHNFYGEVFTEESKEYNDVFTTLNLGYLWQFHKNIGFMLSFGKEVKAAQKQALIGYTGLQFVY